jgi:CheY-like chemotaxis protein
VDASDTPQWPGAQSAPGRAPESVTVMVVEDDSAVRQTLSDLMGGSGYRVVSIHSAEHAIELLNVVAPDLILADVHMGALSGIDLCRRLKSDPRYELTPVVLLSAVSDIVILRQSAWWRDGVSASGRRARP